MKRATILALALLLCGATPAREVAAPASQVLFVCEHGNVKSLMAASYFNQLAEERGLPFRSVSRGSAPDSTTVPPKIVAGLSAEGFDVHAFQPMKVSGADISASRRVVTIGVALPEDLTAGAAVEQWNDVPAASIDYAAARSSLRSHVMALLDQLASNSPPLVLEAKIPLGKVAGRIDHLAFDPRRQRLYVAELGNNSIGIVDLSARKLIRTVGGFEEPQGVGYEPGSDTIFVANRSDGSLRLFRGDDFEPIAQIALGDDADNVRVDPEAGRVYVGYGDGALAVIDAETRKKVINISLEGHPESFQLEPGGERIFVNVPDATQIAVVSRSANRQIASWPTRELRANYPLAIDAANSRVISVFRKPARLEAFALSNGQHLAGTDVCLDADDLFADPKRRRIYVICGEGFVDTFDTSGESFKRLARVPTASGSRTGLFITELDLLLVAVRASDNEAAAVWVLRPGA